MKAQVSSLTDDSVWIQAFDVRYIEEKLRTGLLVPAALIGFGFLLVYFKSIFQPFLLAWILKVMFNPMVEFIYEPLWPLVKMCCGDRVHDGTNHPCIHGLARVKLPKIIAVLCVLSLVGTVLSGLAVAIIDSFKVFLKDRDKYVEVIQQEFNRARKNLEGTFAEDTVNSIISDAEAFIKSRDTISSLAGEVFEWLLQTASRVFTIFLMYMFLQLGGKQKSMSERDEEAFRGTSRVSTAKEVMSRYLVTQSLVSLVTATVCGFIYCYYRVPLWFICALLTFWLNFIPVIGSIVATAIPLPLALVSPYMTTTDILIMFACACTVQQTIGILTNVIMGKAMTLHPVCVLMGMSMLGTLWGIVGMLLAVPALGLTKAVASSNAHPYAQYVAFMLEGDMQGAHDEWKKAKLIAQRQAEMDHQRSMRNTGMSYRDSVANPHSGRSSGASRRSLNQEGITAFSHSPV